MGNILKFFTPIVDGITSHFKGRQEIKAAKLAGQIKIEAARVNAELAISEAKITMARNGQSNDFDLDRIAMKNMEKSYKDEVVLAVFLIPMIMAFIPGFSEYALNGFTIIEQMPEWYRYIIIGMVVVIYGMRGMLTKLLESKNIFSKQAPIAKVDEVVKPGK